MSPKFHFHKYVIIKSHTAIKMLPHVHTLHFTAASPNSQNQLTKLQLTNNK